MYIYLVRHGETDWNTKLLFQGHTDIKLNKNGIKQAKCIAKAFMGQKLDAIISSDLTRAVQTAAEISKKIPLKCAIIKEKGFRERNYGNLEGTTYNRYHRQDKSFTGEKDKEFFARVNSTFDRVVKEHRDEDIAIVAHGGVVRQIIAYILGLKNYKKLRVYNASISEIFYNPEKRGFFLLSFNSVAHLPKSERNKIQYHIKGV
jgi:broad specificity phosphatase PhoE